MTPDTTEPASLTCPQCGLTTYNINDIEFGYCAKCHMFHSDMREKGN